MTALLETCCEVFPFLLFFLGFEDAGWVSGLVGGGIRIRHSDVYDALGPTSPKASEQDVAAIILFRWLLVAGLAWRASFYILSTATTDEGFVAYC